MQYRQAPYSIPRATVTKFCVVEEFLVFPGSFKFQHNRYEMSADVAQSLKNVEFLI